jgi:RNA polymerase sigma factor (sigma-70 family)
MSSAGTTGLTDAEIEAAYRMALNYARMATLRMNDEFRTVAIDAATDAVLWAAKKYDSSRGGWLKFARFTVRQSVRRKLSSHRDKLRRWPAVISAQEERGDGLTLSDMLADERRSAHLADFFGGLPTELQFIARLVYIDRLSLIECGLLTGLSPETIRTRICQAAELLRAKA